ncbi:MAG: hypothetical protein ACOY9Y_02545 [Bacillota bacterium]
MGRKISYMIGLSLLLAGLAYFLGYAGITWGVLAGLPVAVFNHWLVASAVIPAGGRPPTALFGRSMARLLLSLAVLTASLLVSVDFTLGVAIALLTNMVTYLGDVWQAIRLIQNTGQKSD